MMGWLLSLYIGATVFGVGVTVLDMIGALGGDQDADGADADGAGSDGGDGDAFDADDGLDDGGDSEADFDSSGDDDAGDDATDHEPAVLGHDRRRSGGLVVRFMSFLRNIVYFSLGFGPVGWFAIATGEGTTATLAWSAGSGVLILLGARILRRVLRSELTSDFKETDLLMETGTVNVTIQPGQIGRVRLTIGGAYVDRYARSKDTEVPITPGTQVRVVDLGSDAVIVERE
jgi:membrane protein implicated in regulation of membrane protease activity